MIWCIKVAMEHNIPASALVAVVCTAKTCPTSVLADVWNALLLQTTPNGTEIDPTFVGGNATVRQQQ